MSVYVADSNKMNEYIEFHEHRVDNPKGLVFFSPPYLIARERYEAVFTVLEALNLEVVECCRDDVEMTRDTNGMRIVADLMKAKLETLRTETMIDVGMSLGAGFTALAREESKTVPKGRLILSPTPDPVTPWDEQQFQPFLDKANGGKAFEAGKGNYETLKAIKAANDSLSPEVPTQVVAEVSRGMNSLAVINAWATKVGAQVETCLYVHGIFRNKGPLPSLVEKALIELV